MLSESSPPGFSGTVAKMKTHMPAAKAFALAWAGYKKGNKAHYPPEKGKPRYVTPETWRKRRAKKLGESEPKAPWWKPRNKPCQQCKDNPNMPAGREPEAEIQVRGKWLCKDCYDRLIGKNEALFAYFNRLDESAPPVLSQYLHNSQVTDLGKHGWFHAYSCLPVENPPGKVMTLDQYKKEGTPDPVIDNYDIPQWLTKISAGMDKLDIDKQPGMVLFAAPDSAFTSGASGWMKPGEMAAHGGTAPIRINRKPSSNANGKYAAWKGPRSPHTLVHEFAHQVWFNMSPDDRKRVVDFYDKYVAPNPAQAVADKISPTDYGASKASEFWAEIVGYSLFGTERLNPKTLAFLKNLKSGVKDAPAPAGKTEPVSTKAPVVPGPLKDVPVASLFGTVLTGTALHDGGKVWNRIFVWAASQPGKKDRDAVRKALADAGYKAVGSISGSGSPSVWQKGNGELWYVNHPQGVAVAQPGYTLKQLKSLLEDFAPEPDWTDVYREDGGLDEEGPEDYAPRLPDVQNYYDMLALSGFIPEHEAVQKTKKQFRLKSLTVFPNGRVYTPDVKPEEKPLPPAPPTPGTAEEPDAEL